VVFVRSWLRRLFAAVRYGPWSCRVIAAAIALTITASHAAEVQSLEIVSKSGVHVFSVEVAVTDEERARGLMFRRELPEGRGMLFDFKRDQEVAMWMQNTYVPLDMIFIRGDGRILRIAENTEPLSTRIISSGGPVRAVLEVVAGTARKLGILPGDRVAHPLFGGRT
jgi:uncharacterized membrane protein (UPF0127 family)